MKPTQLEETLNDLLAEKWPIFIWGAPGVGKSSIVKEVAATKKLDVIDIRASLLDPTDLRGIPAVVDGQARWLPPSFLPQKANTKGLLFFDELNAAPPLVQASLYQLTLDRRVGEYVLPDGWKIVAAGNRASDAAIVFKMPSALANRFIHLDLEPDVDDWASWAMTRDLHPLVVSFIRLRRELLLDMTDTGRGFPTPRSWEMLSDTFKVLKNPMDAEDVIIGMVGEGAAMELLGFIESAITEDEVAAILANPETAKLPDNLGHMYALISYISSRATEESVQVSAGKLLSRVEPEWAVIMARDILRVAPLFAKEPNYLTFIEKHSSLLV